MSDFKKIVRMFAATRNASFGELGSLTQPRNPAPRRKTGALRVSTSEASLNEACGSSLGKLAAQESAGKDFGCGMATILVSTPTAR